MTSAAMRPAGSRGQIYGQGGRGYGLVLFAGVLMLVAGFWNMIYGIAAIANSHVFVANAHYVFGDLRAWGWVTLIFAILLLVDWKSTRLNSSHVEISYAVLCLKKKTVDNKKA